MNELCGVNKQRNRRVALGFRFHPGELNTEIGSMEGIKKWNWVNGRNQKMELGQWKE